MSSRPNSLRPALTVWAIAGVLFGGTVLLFSRAISYGFTNYDDPRYITANPHIQHGLGWADLKWAFTGNADYWHPLTWISHMVDWQLFADNAAGHHLTSVLWHAVNAVLAFFVLRRLTGSEWLSAFAAALFAWHPLRVESVVWITERKDVMSGCFFLLTVWAYLAYAENRREEKPALARYALALVFFGTGLMCKPTLVTLPFVLLALDFWPARRLTARLTPRGEGTPPTWKTNIRKWRYWLPLLGEKVPFFALSLIAAFATVRMQQGVGAFTLELPLGARLANVPVAIARYLGKFFWPTNLAVCYPHPGWWPLWAVIASSVIVIAISLAAWRWRESRPWVATGWWWFLAMLLPTIGIVQVGFQSLADRYTYIPMLGWEIALLWTAREWLNRANGDRVAVALGSLVLLGCAARTWDQQANWRDSVTLFRHALAVTKDNGVAEGFLGYTLANIGQNAEAELHSTRALALNSRNEMAVFTLAGIRKSQGRIDEAISGFRAALKLRPDNATTEYQLGILLLQRGDTAEATTYLRSAARLDPDTITENLMVADLNARAEEAPRAGLYYLAATILEPENAHAYVGVGLALKRLGREAEALTSFTRAVELKPNSIEAHLELGLLLLKRGDPAAAVIHFRAALVQDPHLALANAGLGRAEEQLGHRAAATSCFQQALADTPDNPDVNGAWAEILGRRGQFVDAVPYYQRALRARPNDATNHAGLGYVLFLTGRRAEAIAEWKEALRLNPNFPGLRERVEKYSGER